MSNVMGPDTAQDRNRIFERLVDQYQESVLRMCYYCLCDKTQAEDATQETFLKHSTVFDVGGGKANAAMSSGDQIFGGVVASGKVFQTHITELRGVDIAVDQHHRNIETHNGIKEFVLEDSGEEQTVYIPALQKGDKFFRSVDGAQHEIVAILPKGGFNGTDGSGMERVFHEVGIFIDHDMIDKADHLGGVGYQSTGGHVGNIAQLLDGIVDALDRLGRYSAGFTVDHV